MTDERAYWLPQKEHREVEYPFYCLGTNCNQLRMGIVLPPDAPDDQEHELEVPEP